MSYTFFNISSSFSIGDSLSTVNLNYENLDNWIASVQLSAQNLWKPLVNYYQVKQRILKASSDIGAQYKPSWDDCTTRVQVNSAKWLEPMVVFYPEVLTSIDLSSNQNITPTTQSSITNWINTNFATIPSNGIPLYIQNQKAYVYMLKTQSDNPIKNVRYLQDTGACSTNDVTVTAYCTNVYSGYVYCSNGDMNCNGQSNGCNQSVTCPCRYIQTGSYNYNPVIAAYLNFDYTNTYESSDIICLLYEMQGCDWVYVRQL
jgi:hypothetical protein